MSRRLRFWLITLAALAGMAATASLGHWQLSRAAQKEALQAAIDQRAARQPMTSAELAVVTDPGTVVHRRASVRGTWLGERTVFLDNRPMNGRAGFYVVTPLRLEGTQAAVLVERGWVPRNFEDRTRLPAVATPAGVVDVTGRIAPPPSKLFEFSGVDSGLIRQNLDLAEFRAETGLPLLAVSLLQSGPAGDGLARDWPPVTTGVEMHYGYAFQWFGLCALMAVLYVWFQIVQRLRTTAAQSD